mgnify:CR=1 FL=1
MGDNCQHQAVSSDVGAFLTKIVRKSEFALLSLGQRRCAKAFPSISQNLFDTIGHRK